MSMEVQRLGASVAAGERAISSSTRAAVTPESKGFAEFLQEHIDEVSTQNKLADHAIEQLATGQSDNVHEVVLAMAKADLNFRMVLEIRNKMVDAYQEIMRMQV